jgi:hypothetical protein
MTFPRSLTTTPFERSSTGRSEACFCRAASGGLLPSLIQHHGLSPDFGTHITAVYFLYENLLTLLREYKHMETVAKAWERELDVLHERLGGLFRRPEPRKAHASR